MPPHSNSLFATFHRRYTSPSTKEFSAGNRMGIFVRTYSGRIGRYSHLNWVLFGFGIDGDNNSDGKTFSFPISIIWSNRLENWSVNKKQCLCIRWAIIILKGLLLKSTRSTVSSLDVTFFVLRPLRPEFNGHFCFSLCLGGVFFLNSRMVFWKEKHVWHFYVLH